MSSRSRPARAGTSIRSLPRDLLSDVGGHPDGLPRSELLEHSGFVFFLNRLLKERGIKPRGVIHLGANLGQEALPYMMIGFAKVLFVEAHPEVFLELARNVTQLNLLDGELSKCLGTMTGTRFDAVQAAIGDRNGEATLYVTGSSLFCSTRRPLDFSEWIEYVIERSTEQEAVDFRAWAEQAVALTGQMTVAMYTLDHLMEQLPSGLWEPADFNVLSMNIQGAELDALKGAELTLRRIEFIQTEKNYAEHYEGNAMSDEVDCFLTEAGFAELTTLRAGPVGTTAYIRTAARTR